MTAINIPNGRNIKLEFQTRIVFFQNGKKYLWVVYMILATVVYLA